MDSKVKRADSNGAMEESQGEKQEGREASLETASKLSDRFRFFMDREQKLRLWPLGGIKQDPTFGHQCGVYSVREHTNQRFSLTNYRKKNLPLVLSSHLMGLYRQSRSLA